ncbi:Ribonuclease BN, tRNA processing enzyme [Paracoccus halophilus]|uniref:Ribonuclease BN, tRNA processing enzyme n=1 Tax=Paracoccus halophilus TaxID=376733 RepID=A0A1I0TC71_9RHOB|nr:MBL fold metallo-hydrolase [Paracoccus halophilus]SFA49382.1 Ribonuclease BN, tRNA processing enzyme [Paracoccus halophilus]
MKVTMLGTGNPAPSLRRMGSGYLLEIADDVIVLDHGPGAHHRLLQAGRKPTEITHMMFSHLHYDHCVDFPRLVLTRWDQGAGQLPELKIYGPPPTAQFVDRLLGENGAYRFDIEARCGWESSLNVYQLRGGKLPRKPPSPSVQEYSHGSVIETDNWRLTIAEVPHAQPYLTCLALRFDTDQGSFVYSGDAGPCDNLLELAQDCDLMIHMCCNISGTVNHPAHLKGNTGHLELAEIGRKTNAGTIVATHIYDQFDLPGVRERVIAEMSQIYKGNLVFGEDLMELGLKPNAMAAFD